MRRCSTILTCNPLNRIFATLGRQSKVRKVSKKAIASVDIHAACQVIVSSKHQVPLRISSQLMAGLARVYVSQVHFFLLGMHAVRAVACTD